MRIFLNKVELNSVTIIYLNMEDVFHRGKITISNGVSYIEIDDQYEHPPDSTAIEYLIENVPFEPNSPTVKNSKEFEHLVDLMNSIYTRGCNCTDLLAESCIHGGNYIAKNRLENDYKDDSDSIELVLNPNRKIHDLIYECSSIMCKCTSLCKNRLVQYGPRKKLKIIDSMIITNQKGLMTMESIPKGGFICEYAGEIITKSEAERRIHINNTEAGNQMNYVICLNENCIDSSYNGNSDDDNNVNIKERNRVSVTKEDIVSSSSSSLASVSVSVSILASKTGKILMETGEKTLFQTFIDPSKKGNIGRYLNHSCEPNCQILSVRVDGPLPKLGIFAKRNINAYEELSFHYADGNSKNYNKTFSNEQQHTRRPCYCGSKNCEKFLPNNIF